MIKFLKNFREFAVKGTVVDMGVGVIVGTAFIRIVDSLVKDIIMPPLGLILGRVDFSNLYINLSGGHYLTLADAKDAGAVTINYGLFIDAIINFGIIALAAYFTILQINRIKRAPAESMSSKECPYCFVNIPVRAVRCPSCTTILIPPELEKEPTPPEQKKSKLNKTESEPDPTKLSTEIESEQAIPSNKDERKIKITFKHAKR